MANERIEQEIKKCQLLCANCHRIKTHQQLNFLKLEELDENMIAIADEYLKSDKKLILGDVLKKLKLDYMTMKVLKTDKIVEKSSKTVQIVDSPSIKSHQIAKTDKTELNELMVT